MWNHSLLCYCIALAGYLCAYLSTAINEHTFWNAFMSSRLSSWPTLLRDAWSHRHSACATWKWQRSWVASGHVARSAAFSAAELSVMKHCGACRKHTKAILKFFFNQIIVVSQIIWSPGVARQSQCTCINMLFYRPASFWTGFHVRIFPLDFAICSIAFSLPVLTFFLQRNDLAIHWSAVKPQKWLKETF